MKSKAGSTVVHKKLNSHKSFKKGSLKQAIPSHLLPSLGWLHRFMNRFRLENVRNTEEAASADEEAVATFRPEWKKLVTERESS